VTTSPTTITNMTTGATTGMTTDTTTSTSPSTTTRTTVTMITKTTTSTNTTTTTTTPTSTTRLRIRRRVRARVRVRLSKIWHCLTHAPEALVVKPYKCDNCPFQRAPARLDMAIIFKNCKIARAFRSGIGGRKMGSARIIFTWVALNWCPFSGLRNWPRARPRFLLGAARSFVAGGGPNKYVEGKFS